jgi:Cys-tRNA(Pro) deacylase
MADNQTLHAYLLAAGVDHRLIETPAETKTAAAAAGVLGVQLGAIVKSLVCVAEQATVIVLVPGDRELSLSSLARVLQTPDVHLAPRRVVERATGYPVGGVSPLAHPQVLPVFGDDSLRTLEVVYCGGGTHHHMLEIAVRDLERLAAVRWETLTTEPHPPQAIVSSSK